ncbi:MAG TPA: NUDIX domain-containing protein [Candidatus Glassbacteria bacterium]|nr:NUDIX domain-containing protein [Candidatus Glassbacteria bacterium]
MYFLKKPKLKSHLLNYTVGHWGFVKGNVEFNETEKENVLRELEEETGILDAKFIEGFKENITYVYIQNGEIVHKNVFLFLIETNTSDIKISFEHVAFL